jgi:protein SCO1
VSQKALLAVCLAVLIPLGSYYLVKYASDGAIAMPRHLYYDSIAIKMKDGKKMEDTLWHRVENINLTNQLGQPFSLDSIRNKVIVADFFFTHCPNICPTLTRNMKQLQDALKVKEETKNIDTPFVQFLSFTVDPKRDSATVLKAYADKYGVNPDLWMMLTGPKQDIYDFALKELKMGIADGEGADSNFIHTQKMVLLDKQHIVRGYYDGLDSASMSKLARDIVYIMLEKDKNSKSELSALKPLLPLFIIVLLGITIAVIYFSRKNDADPVRLTKKEQDSLKG